MRIRIRVRVRLREGLLGLEKMGPVVHRHRIIWNEVKVGVRVRVYYFIFMG